MEKKRAIFEIATIFSMSSSPAQALDLVCWPLDFATPSISPASAVASELHGAIEPSDCSLLPNDQRSCRCTGDTNT